MIGTHGKLGKKVIVRKPIFEINKVFLIFLPSHQAKRELKINTHSNQGIESMDL